MISIIALRKAIDKSPDDPLAQKALVQLRAMKKRGNLLTSFYNIKDNLL